MNADRHDISPGAGIARHTLTMVCMTCCCGLILAVAPGCRMTVGGQQRSLVQNGPLQGEVELTAEKRKDDQGTSGDTRRYESLEYKEILRLKTQGNVYHPDLLTYRASAGIGSTQHEFKFDGEKDTGTGSLEEYMLAGDLLPQKPFPLSFQLDKSEELLSRQFASSLLSQRKGANVTLSLRSDWPIRLQFGQNETRQEGQSVADHDLFIRDDQRFSASLDHVFSDSSEFGLDVHHNDTSQFQAGTTIHHQESVVDLSHHLTGGPNQQNRLDSFINYLDQSGDFDLKRLHWQESLNLKHSDVFQTYYRIFFLNSERSTLKNNEIRGETGFTHQLYDSLTTHGSVYTSKANLGDGVDLTQLGGAVTFDYRKINSLGLLLGHYGFNVLDLEQTGGSTRVAVVNERHAFTTAGSLRIQLERTNIDPASIVVRNSARTKIYTDYTVTQTNGITEIDIILGGDITTDGDQTLSFDYDAVTDPQRKEQSYVHSFRLRERFPFGLSTYYEFQDRSETLTSTETSIVPDEFQVHLWGVDYNHKGLRLLSEYRDEASTRYPFQSKRLEASYALHPEPASKLTFYASQRWIDYRTEPMYDVQLFTVGCDIQTGLSDSVTATGRLDYRDEDDSRQGTTRGFQWDTELQYRYRQLDARVGAEFNTLNRLNYESDGLLMYVRLKRFF